MFQFQCVARSSGSVTASLREWHKAPETEAAKWNSAFSRLAAYTSASPAVLERV